MAGRLDLPCLDESGFAPTLPTTYTWARAAARARVPYEAPQRRRVNVPGAGAPFGAAPRFAYTSRAGKLDSAAFLAFLWRAVGAMTTPLGDVPADFRRARRCAIVPDNHSAHHSRAVKAARPGLEAAGIELFYLPASSPELNPIEGLWRHVKGRVLANEPTPDLDASLDRVTDELLSMSPSRVRNLAGVNSGNFWLPT